MKSAFGRILKIGIWIGAITAVLRLLPIPIFESNSTTLLLPTQTAQIATAKALGASILGPTAQLDTANVQRFLFKDSTSVDWLPVPPVFKPMYPITVLKQVNLSLFSWTNPTAEIKKMKLQYEVDGFKCEVQDQPDPAFNKGDVVLLMSEALRSTGVAIIVRKNALRMSGPSPRILFGPLRTKVERSSEMMSAPKNANEVVIAVMRRDPETLTTEERTVIGSKFPGKTLSYVRIDGDTAEDHDQKLTEIGSMFAYLPGQRAIPTIAMQRGVQHFLIRDGQIAELEGLEVKTKEFVPRLE